MSLTIVAVWSWKDRKLVSIEQVPDFRKGIDRQEELKKKYFTKAPAREKSEVEKFVEDVTWSEDPNYEVILETSDAANLEIAKQEIISEKSGA